jgi:hypothetical protein
MFHPREAPPPRLLEVLMALDECLERLRDQPRDGSVALGRQYLGLAKEAFGYREGDVAGRLFHLRECRTPFHVGTVPGTATGPVLRRRRPRDAVGGTASRCEDALMPKVRTTLTIDEDVLRAVKIRAARTGKGDSAVIEEAVRRDLGLDLLEELWSRNRLPEEAATKLAVEAQHATRRRRR